ncbi:hypothetical protein [Mycobacterium helveticum]|uniref:Uncharacterized protein n=1 Tax=Mycobacterium helveticum TaxID=2592811 RepID=A0A557XVI0_9MYCO|nr:hypothetical protein [Mycobacterium helveticum]TVS86038.1 hypothetical protein FPZ46_12620 [Mycobacterium helveticum]TVS90023.1 hypothetical protein FPZ47_10825 [Mycobacterium helveticum]
MTINRNRGILGPPADLGPKANDVDGGLAEQPRRTGQFNGDTSQVTDQGGVGTAAERAGLQDAFRAAQAAAGMIGADQGAGGARVAPSGSPATGSIPDGTLGDTIGAPEPLVTRADGGDDPSMGAYGKAL